MFNLKNLSKQRCQELILVFIFFIGSLLVRALFGLYGIELDRPFTGDEGGFHWRALRLIDGELGQRAYRAPLSAMAIAPSYWLFGSAPEVGRWTMVVISSICAPTLFILASRISGNIVIGVIAGLIWVVYPPSIYYSTLIYTETLSALLVILSLLGYFCSSSSGRLIPALFTGLLLGCLALNRATYLLLPLCLLILSLIFGSLLSFKPRMKTIQWVLIWIGFVGVLTPWTMHTYDLYEKFMPHNVRGGWTLLISNGNIDHEMVKEGGYSREHEYYFSSIESELNPVRLDELRRQMAVRLILDHIKNRPLDYSKIIVKRIRNFWTFRPNPYKEHWTKNDWIMLVIWGPIFVLAVVSLRIIRWRKMWPLGITILYSFFIVMPFWGTPRFRYPVDPLIVVMAAWSLAYWYSYFRKYSELRRETTKDNLA